MTSLISRLNALQNLTPDEIVTKLTTRGWRKPSEVGEDYFRENMTTPHAYWMVAHGRPSGTRSRDWTFASCVGSSGSYAEFISRLETNQYRRQYNEVYWVIPTSEDTGEPPPCAV